MAPRVRTGAIDEAEAFVIRMRDASVREAAEKFGLSKNTLRARIDNKYGGLQLARAAGYIEPKRIRAPVRRCIRCRVSSAMDRGQHICNHCRKEIASIHDGAV